MRNLSFVVLLVTVSAAMALPFGKYGLGGYGGGVGLTQNVPVVAVSPLTFGFGGGSKKSGGAAPAPAAPAPNVVVVPAPAAPAPAPVPASPAAPAASPSEGGPQIASYRSSAIVNAPIFVQTERLQPVQQFTSQPIMSNFNMKPIMQNVPVQGGETQAVVEVNAPEGNFPALTIQAPQAVSESIPRPTYTLRQNVASAILGSTQQAPTQYNAFTSNFKPIMSNLNLQPILQNVPVQGGEMQAVVDVNAPQGNFPALNIQAPQAVSESIPQPTYTLQQSVASAILGSTQQAPTQYQSFMSNVKPIMSNLNMQPIMQNVPVQGGEMQAVVDVNAPQGSFPALNIQAPQAVSESMPSPTYRLEQNVASAILGSTQQAPTQYQSFTSNIKPIMSNLNLQPIMQNVPVQGGEMQAVVDVNAPQGNFPALNVQAPQAVSESMPSPTYRLEQNVASAILGSTQQAPTQYQSFTSNFGRAAVMAGSKS